MISQEEARARVARGAAHLDTVRPGWFNRIDTGTLTLHDPCGCIVGQLCGSDTERFYHDIVSLGVELPPSSADQFGADEPRNRVVAAHGFDLTYAEYGDYTDHGDRFRPLQDAWIEAIADRKLAGKLIETPAPVSSPVGV